MQKILYVFIGWRSTISCYLSTVIVSSGSHMRHCAQCHSGHFSVTDQRAVKYQLPVTDAWHHTSTNRYDVVDDASRNHANREAVSPADSSRVEDSLHFPFLWYRSHDLQRIYVNQRKSIGVTPAITRHAREMFHVKNGRSRARRAWLGIWLLTRIGIELDRKSIS